MQRNLASANDPGKSSTFDLICSLKPTLSVLGLNFKHWYGGYAFTKTLSQHEPIAPYLQFFADVCARFKNCGKLTTTKFKLVPGANTLSALTTITDPNDPIAGRGLSLILALPDNHPDILKDVRRETIVTTTTLLKPRPHLLTAMDAAISGAIRRNFNPG